MTPLLKKEIQKNGCIFSKNNSLKDFEFIIFGLPAFSLSQFCRCGFAKFENYKLQSFRNVKHEIHIISK